MSRVARNSFIAERLAEVWIGHQPRAFGLEAFRHCGVVIADEFTDHTLQHFTVLCVVLARRSLLRVQARDGDAVALPDNDRAGVNRVVKPECDFGRNIPEEKLEFGTKRHRLANRGIGHRLTGAPTHIAGRLARGGASVQTDSPVQLTALPNMATFLP